MGLMAEPGDDLAEQMLALTERLRGLIEEETLAIRARRLDAAGAGFEEKERLARVYRTEFNRIRANPDLIGAARPELRARLATEAKALEAALETHGASLAAFKEISEGLVRAIAAEIVDAKAAPQGYSGGGRSTPRTGATGVAVNVRG